MSDDLQKPPVVDLDVLLQPISDESPSGENLRYSGLYDDISNARRADDTLNQGDWQSEVKVADYSRVIDLSVSALSTKSKDMQVAAWLSEALIKEFGFAGLRDGMKLLAGLQENFWDTLHPEVDEGDMEGRANAISWLDTQGSFAIKGAPITSGPGYGFLGFEDSKRFDIPDNLESLGSEEQQKYNDLKYQAETEKRVTTDMWRKAVAQTRRAFCEELNYTIGECWEAFKELNRVIEEKYERNQMPGLSELKRSLDAIGLQTKKMLDEKRLEEPDESDAGFVDGESGDASDGSGRGGSAGAVQGRHDALKRLGEIAAFFQRTEPHSPVAYLVQRAVKWGNMPLDSWLQDVIKDDTVLHSLRQTLGLDTTGVESSSDYVSEETPATTEEEWQ
jgi:type VI secretion system protein ImpA